MSNPRYGKGDSPRPTNKRLYDENYDVIFRKPIHLTVNKKSRKKKVKDADAQNDKPTDDRTK